MRQHDRRHRVLAALRAGALTYRELKRAVRKPGGDWDTDKQRTFSTMMALVDDGLLWVERGEAGLQPAGAVVLKAAEAAWAAEAEQVAA